ncbi:unnamed protein product, partial [Scytosiphon promiscuus]
GLRFLALLYTYLGRCSFFSPRSFYRFEPLTLIPMQKKLLDQSLLSPKELDWLDDYHSRVSAVQCSC